MSAPSFSLAENAIYNPQNSNHFMRLKPIKQLVTAKIQDRILACSKAAVYLLEVGKDIYNPIVYFPKADVQAKISPLEHLSTHCPLKGNASYWSFEDENEKLAWSYEDPFEFSAELKGKLAFYPKDVSLIFEPLDQT